MRNIGYLISCQHKVSFGCINISWSIGQLDSVSFHEVIECVDSVLTGQYQRKQVGKSLSSSVKSCINEAILSSTSYERASSKSYLLK